MGVVIVLTLVGAVVAAAKPIIFPQAAPPTISLPTWASTYDWPAGDGYAGWEREPLANDAHAYGLATSLHGQSGLWLWPAGDRRYEPGAAGFTLTAPGTTRIGRATLELAYNNSVFAHHCLRVGLRTGAGVRDGRVWCKPPAPPATQDQMEVRLADPAAAPIAKELYIELVVPACDKPGTACAKWIPAKDPQANGPMVHVKSGDLVLVDDDAPVVTPSRAFWELDGTYIDGKQTYPLRVDSHDAGGGITRIDIDHTGWPGPQPPLARHEVTCDPDHHTASLGARNCTPDDAIDLAVDTRPMPEGTRSFRAFTPDVAGNVGDRRWTVIIDRTAPTTPHDLHFTTPEEGSAQAAWDAADDPVLPDGTPGSGVKYYEARWQIDGGPWSAFDRMPSNARLSDELFDHPDGTEIGFEVRAIDAVGNVGDVASTRGRVYGSAPRVSTSGRISDLSGGYIGAEQAPLQVQATDDGVGVRRVWVDHAGGQRLGTADGTCSPRTRSDGRPWKDLCDASASGDFTIDTGALPEGQQTLVASAIDRAHNVGHVDLTLLVDRSAPTPPANAALLGYDAETRTAQLVWEDGDDPDLPDETPGSGVTTTEYQVIHGGSAGAWQSTRDGEGTVGDLSLGESVVVRMRSVDEVGNRSGEVEMLATARDESPAGEDTPPADEGVGALRDRAETLAPADYAGSYRDSAGVLVFRFTDDVDGHIAALRSGLEDPSRVRGVGADFTMQRLRDVEAQLDTAMDDSSGILSVGINDRTNRVEIGVTDPGAAWVAGVIASYGGAVRAFRDELRSADNTGPPAINGVKFIQSRTVFKDPMQAGLQIYHRNDDEKADRGCTSGFGFRAGEGGGQFPQRYQGLLTAGHCVYDIGEEWRQGGHELGAAVDRAWKNGSKADVASISTSNFPIEHRDPSNKVFINSAVTQAIRHVQDPHDDAVGSTVWMSGAVTGIKKGTLIGRGSKVYNRRADGQVRMFTNQRLARFHCAPGDSGSPVYSGSTAIGIVMASSPRGCYYSHIGHALDAMHLVLTTH